VLKAQPLVHFRQKISAASAQSSTILTFANSNTRPNLRWTKLRSNDNEELTVSLVCSRLATSRKPLQLSPPRGFFCVNLDRAQGFLFPVVAHEINFSGTSSERASELEQKGKQTMGSGL
jgi:hypothetical protein